MVTGPKAHADPRAANDKIRIRYFSKFYNFFEEYVVVGNRENTRC